MPATLAARTFLGTRATTSSNSGISKTNVLIFVTLFLSPTSVYQGLNI
jgi:hypothetical protein